MDVKKTKWPVAEGKDITAPNAPHTLSGGGTESEVFSFLESAARFHDKQTSFDH